MVKTILFVTCFGKRQSRAAHDFAMSKNPLIWCCNNKQAKL